jgi:RNA polymerase sigma-70 factor (ECF subfamily)
MDDLEGAIRRMRDGDVEAFEAIYREYEGVVYRTAFFLAGDAGAAADVVQEVFIAVWKYRRTYNPAKAGFATWLHRITVNQCSKKKSRASKFVPIEGLGDERDPIPAPDADSPDEITITRDEYRALLDGLTALDKKHRAVLVLRFFNDLSYQEIAEAAHIPLDTVKSRLNAGLKQLSRLLSGQVC